MLSRRLAYILGAAAIAAALLLLTLRGGGPEGKPIVPDRGGETPPPPRRFEVGVVDGASVEPIVDAPDSLDISFLVTSTEVRTPVAGVRVRILRCPEKVSGSLVSDPVEALTGADGRVVVRVPDLWASETLLATAESEDGLLAVPCPVRCSVGDSVEMALVRSCRIEGIVSGLGPEEHKIARVLGWSFNWPESPKRRLFEVSPDGSFTVPGVVGHIKLYALADSRAPSPYWEATLSQGKLNPGSVHRVTLDLGAPANPITVSLTDLSGEPLAAGCKVAACVPGRAWTTSWTDERGRVVLEGIPNGEDAQVHVWPQRKPGGDGWLTLGGDFTVSHHQEGTTLSVPRAAANQRFQLLDKEGRPAPDVLLHLKPVGDGLTEGGWSDTTGADGEFAPFSDRPHLPGSFALTLHDGTELWRGEAGLEESTVRLQHDMIAVRASILDQAGKPARAPYVGVGVLPAGARASGAIDNPRPSSKFRVFDKREPITFLVPRDLLESGAILRARFRGVGVVDYPLDGDDAIEIQPPPSTGRVHVRLHGIPGSGSVFLTRTDGSREGPSYHAYIYTNGAGYLPGIPAGVYIWNIQGFSVKRAGRDLVVSAGSDTRLEIR